MMDEYFSMQQWEQSTVMSKTLLLDLLSFWRVKRALGMAWR